MVSIEERRGRTYPGQTAAVIAGVVCPVLMIVSNHSVEWTMPLAAIVASFAVLRTEGVRSLKRAVREAMGPVACALLALSVIAAASLAWAPHPGRSSVVLASVAGSIASGFLFVAAFPRLFDNKTEFYLIVGVTVATFLLCIELLFDSSLKRFLNLNPSIPSFNRSLTLLMLLSMPAIAALTKGGHHKAAIVLAALVATALVGSAAQAATLGYLTALCVLAIGFAAPSRTVLVVITFAIAGLLLAPVVLPALSVWLPEWILVALRSGSAYERAEIWRWFGQAVLENHLLGYGFEATRYMGEANIPALSGAPFWAINAGHPHAAMLQVWVELGVPGVIATAVVLASLGRVLQRLPIPARFYAAAAFAGAYTVAYIGHGAWQAWWFASLGLTAGWFAVLGPVEIHREWMTAAAR